MKNKKPTNEIIPILASQFDTIKSILIGAGIVLDTIEPKIDEYSFTTKNDVKKKMGQPSLISSKYFTKINNYFALIQNRAYHFLLFDGSLIKMNYEFTEIYGLKKYNLSWIPCPFSFDYVTDNYFNDGIMDCSLFLDYMDFVDSVELEEIQMKYISMRTPIRIDFDSTYNDSSKESHPLGHIHIQNKDTRLNTEKLFCIYKFMSFILENCYPHKLKNGKKKNSKVFDESEVLINDKMFNEFSEQLFCNKTEKWKITSKFNINF